MRRNTAPAAAPAPQQPAPQPAATPADEPAPFTQEWWIKRGRESLETTEGSADDE